MKLNKNFQKPPKELFLTKNSSYKDDFCTYSHYNYFSNKIISYFKTSHFEKALELTKNYFKEYNVIDFGCADGIFLFSLSKNFRNVLGIDQNSKYLKTAKLIVDKLHLENVDTLCNKELSFSELKDLLGKKEFQVAYILEVLEHIGESPYSMYRDKLNFLNNVFKLLKNNGLIIISVPKMVGFSYFIQYCIFKLLRISWEKLSLMDLFKTVLFRNTDSLEKVWHNSKHIGFNHYKLESFMESKFNIVRKLDLPFQVLYVLRKKGK